MTSRIRRSLLAAGLALPAAGLSGCWETLGILNPCARRTDPGHGIDPALWRSVWEGLDPRRVMDAHVHLAGTGPGRDDPWINPAMRSLANPFSYAHFALVANAACVNGREDDWSRDYVDRLLLLADEFPPGFKMLLFALDGYRDARGALDDTRTVLRVPDAHAAGVARWNPQRFEWAASIHPYREDAIAALERAAADGARAVKWIPYFMGFDPAEPRLRPFYRALARLGLPLITHGGWQHELVRGGVQDYGNPLRLRAALEEGVRVVVSHCGMQGEFLDFETGAGRSLRPSFALFRRLMDAPEYRGVLFGDISAVTIRGREGGALRLLLSHEPWHGRLLNGSDYPGPGILPVMALAGLVEEGVLESGEAERMAHIQQHNPALFDFVVKRRLAWRGVRWPASVFETRDFFVAGRRASQ